MRANFLTGSPKKTVRLLGWFCSIFRALALILGKHKMGNQKVEGKGGWIREKEAKDRRKEKPQRESESRTWVVKDKMLLEHFIFKDPNIYAFLNIPTANISYSLLFPFLFSPLFSEIVLCIRSFRLLLLKVIVLERNIAWQLLRAQSSQIIFF